MNQTNSVKKAAFYSFGATALLLVSQTIIAHTRLEIPNVPEATRVHNYINIGHGCADPSGKLAGEGALKNQPTRGISVVFPNAVNYSPIIGIDATSGGKGTDKVYTTQPASNFYTPLASIGQLIRKAGLWATSNIKADKTNNKDGFWILTEPYDQTIATTVQFDFYSAAVSIPPASCARSVTFELAVADICNLNATSPNIGDSDVLFWSPIPNFSGVPGQPFGTGIADETRKIPVGKPYSSYDGWSNGNTVGMGTPQAKPGDGWNSPATLTVTRDLVKNPLPANCTGNGGKGDDVYIYPSAQQINDELPIWSGAHKGDGTNYWY